METLIVKRETPLGKVALKTGGSLLFYISLLVFFLVITAYGGLIILNSNLQKNREVLLAEVQDKQNNLRPELLEEIFLLDERLKNMRTLLSKHVFTSNVLRLLEADTLEQVRFTNFSFQTSSNKLDMAGETTSYAILAKQIGVLERNPQIEKIEFGGLSFGGNNLLGFKLAVVFKPSLLLLRP